MEKKIISQKTQNKTDWKRRLSLKKQTKFERIKYILYGYKLQNHYKIKKLLEKKVISK